MNTGPGGFSSAPVTKGLLIVTAAASIFLQAATSTPRNTRMRQLPFPLSLAPFRTPGELCFGALLLYYFRMFERHTGSSKYSAYVVLTSLISSWLQLLLRFAGMSQLPTGPYGLIFASFLRFFFDVPPFSTFTLFGWRMTDKVFVYLAGVQLLLSSGWRSAAAGGSGLLAGLLYRQNVFGMQSLRVPAPMGRAFRALFSWMGDAGTTGALVFNARTSGWGAAGGAAAAGAGPGWQPLHQAQQQAAAGGAAGAAQRQAAPQAAVAPSQEAVAQLVSMGFDAGRASQALQQTGNDLQAAIALLL